MDGARQAARRSCERIRAYPQLAPPAGNQKSNADLGASKTSPKSAAELPNRRMQFRHPVATLHLHHAQSGGPLHGKGKVEPGIATAIMNPNRPTGVSLAKNSASHIC